MFLKIRTYQFWILFEEYNKTEDCETGLVYITDNKSVNVKYVYEDLLEFEFCIFNYDIFIHCFWWLFVMLY